jgi:hypothetical protein
MRFKNKREFPKQYEIRIRKKFAWRPVTIRQEGITVWFGYYYIKEKFIPLYNSYNDWVQKYHKGEDYKEEYLKGKWKQRKIATKEQLFIDEL